MDQVVPTGQRGIITKDDILALILHKTTNTKTNKSIEDKTQAKDQDPVKKQTSQGVPDKTSEVVKEAEKGTGFVDLPLTQMRRVIAERLVLSKHTIPGIYLTIDCNLTEIEQLRQTLKNSGTKVRFKYYLLLSRFSRSQSMISSLKLLPCLFETTRLPIPTGMTK